MAIYKCKYSCETIFTEENLYAMNEFSQLITEEELFPKMCRRDYSAHPIQAYSMADAYGCSANTYKNITTIPTLYM